METCGADAELSNNEWWLFAQMERVAGMVKEIRTTRLLFSGRWGTNRVSEQTMLHGPHGLKITILPALYILRPICIMEVQDNMVMASIL